MTLIIIAAAIIFYFELSHSISYRILKNRILKRQKWDLNICCGKTDGGGINADVAKHQDVPNFQLIEDIYNLPFQTAQFDTVLCSHTIEHVDDPARLFNELKRVGKQVTIVIPPLYDITAALNIFEHKYIFFSFKKEHQQLPGHAKLPLASFFHKHIGQINNASANPLALFFSGRRMKQTKPGKRT